MGYASCGGVRSSGESQKDTIVFAPGRGGGGCVLPTQRRRKDEKKRKIKKSGEG